MEAIQFLTRVGQTCTPIRQEFILLSDVFGVSALVDAVNNPPVANGTHSSVLGPFYTEDAPDGQSSVRPRLYMIILTLRCGASTVENGDSIASEGKGENLFVEGRVLSIDGTPVSGATIETWETDGHGEYHSSPQAKTHERPIGDTNYRY